MSIDNYLEKIAINASKRNYHSLNPQNQEILRHKVFKPTGQIADGIARGNESLRKDWNIQKFEKDVFPSGGYGRLQYGKRGSGEIYLPKDFANSSLKDEKDLTAKAVGGIQKHIIGAKNLSDNDKKLYNAMAERNIINKFRLGFDNQLLMENVNSPNYENQEFAKRLKKSRKTLSDITKSGQGGFADLKDIDLKKTIAKNKKIEGIQQAKDVQKFIKSQARKDAIKKIINKQSKAGLITAGIIGGIGTGIALHNKRKKQSQN